MKRLLGVAAAVSVLLLTGCSGFAGSSSAPGPAIHSEAGGSDAGGADTFGPVAPLGDRSVITTGWLSVTVDDPLKSAEEAARIVSQAGGRIDSRNEQPGTDTQKPSASLTLRIPADRFDATLHDLEDLGRVGNLSLNANDVTQQVDDLEARIAVLKASVDRLRALVAQATNVSDLVTLEQALSERQAELDGLTAQRDYLDDQVDFSTLTLELVTEGTIVGPGDFWSGLVAGWNAMVAAAGGFVIALGVALPWLALAAVIAAIVWLILYLTLRRGNRSA